MIQHLPRPLYSLENDVPLQGFVPCGSTNIGAFPRDAGKQLPNHTAQKPIRPARLTVTGFKPQINIFVLLIIYFSDYFIFLTYRLLFMRD